MAALPIFPLGTVLMPGVQLPLQIFEQRYVALLRDLVERQDEQPPVFGVVAIRKGFEVGEDGVKALHAVGCAAQVQQAAELGDRRFLVIAQGTRRFRLGPVDEAAGTPYTVAEVTWLDEPTGDAEEAELLAAGLRPQIAAHRARIGEEPAPPPEAALDLSYWVAQALSLELSDRQQLLSAADTETRLRLGRRLVRREHALSVSLGTAGRQPGEQISLN